MNIIDIPIKNSGNKLSSSEVNSIVDTIKGEEFNIILAGQSNAVGRNNDSLDYPIDLPIDGAVPNAQYFDTEDTWKAFELYMNYYDDTMSGARSIEYRIAKLITEKLGKKVNLLKYAQGGTTLSGAWNPTGSGGYLTQGLEASAQLSNKEYDALIWIQGESDAASEASANLYEENLKTLIQRLRRSINPNMLFIIVRLNDASGGSYTYLETVQTAMDVAGYKTRETLVVEQPNDNPLGSDSVHYTPDGYDAIAKETFKVLKRYIR